MLLTIPPYFEQIDKDRFVQVVGFIIPALVMIRPKG